MSELKTLYKVDTTGKIRQWTVNVNNDTFWTEQGQVDGKIVVNKPTFTTPKNEGRSNATTAEEQALLEDHFKTMRIHAFPRFKSTGNLSYF